MTGQSGTEFNNFIGLRTFYAEKNEVHDASMTTRRSLLRWFTAGAALIAWGAVLLQFYLSLRLAVANGKGVGWGVVIYFGYFTILTNLLVALALSVPLVIPASAPARFFARPGVATAIVAAITLVGAAYFILLRKAWNPQGWQLAADVALHYVTPLLFLLYWWFAVPKRGLGWGAIPKWTVYPIGYFVYLLLRGSLTGLYPYPFIDVSTLGYGRALLNALGVLIGFVAVAALLVGAARLQSASATRNE